MNKKIDEFEAFDEEELSFLEEKKNQEKKKRLTRLRNIAIVVFFITLITWLIVNPEQRDDFDTESGGFQLSFYFGNLLGVLIVTGFLRLISFLPALIPYPKKTNIKIRSLYWFICLLCFFSIMFIVASLLVSFVI